MEPPRSGKSTQAFLGDDSDKIYDLYTDTESGIIEDFKKRINQNEEYGSMLFSRIDINPRSFNFHNGNEMPNKLRPPYANQSDWFWGVLGKRPNEKGDLFLSVDFFPFFFRCTSIR